jgi:fucose 4-O-acetylase-like acetyltransferase
MILRLGFVLILNAVVSLISIRIESIPRIIILIGRNTLLIYVVHLVILYGSAWNPGLSVLFDKAFDLWNTIGSAVLMLGLMTLMVYVIHKLKIKNKEIVT